MAGGEKLKMPRPAVNGNGWDCVTRASCDQKGKFTELGPDRNGVEYSAACGKRSAALKGSDRVCVSGEGGVVRAGYENCSTARGRTSSAY